MEYSREKRNTFETELFHLESRLGVTRGSRSPGQVEKAEPGSAKAALARSSTKDCNTLYTSLIYLERRLDFIIGFANFILGVLKQLRESKLATSMAQAERIAAEGRRFEENVTNILSLARNQAHQNTCLQKRAQALLNAVSCVICPVKLC